MAHSCVDCLHHYHTGVITGQAYLCPCESRQDLCGPCQLPGEGGFWAADENAWQVFPEGWG